VRASVVLAIVIVGCGEPRPEQHAPAPLSTPFVTVEQPTALCGERLEQELRARPIGLPTCHPTATDIRYVRARAGSHDVIVIALDDSRETWNDGPVEHYACLVVDGELRGASCSGAGERTTLDAALGALSPASLADARALLRAAVLLDRGSPEVDFDVAARDARAAASGAASDPIRSVDVELDSAAPRLTAVAVRFDQSYGGWEADITRYDAEIDAQGHVVVSTSPILRANGTNDAHPPWAVPDPVGTLGPQFLLGGEVTGTTAAPVGDSTP
jgi:hypothetical protein